MSKWLLKTRTDSEQKLTRDERLMVAACTMKVKRLLTENEYLQLRGPIDDKRLDQQVCIAIVRML